MDSSLEAASRQVGILPMGLVFYAFAWWIWTLKSVVESFVYEDILWTLVIIPLQDSWWPFASVESEIGPRLLPALLPLISTSLAAAVLTRIILKSRASSRPGLVVRRLTFKRHYALAVFWNAVIMASTLVSISIPPYYFIFRRIALFSSLIILSTTVLKHSQTLIIHFFSSPTLATASTRLDFNRTPQPKLSLLRPPTLPDLVTLLSSSLSLSNNSNSSLSISSTLSTSSSSSSSSSNNNSNNRANLHFSLPKEQNRPWYVRRKPPSIPLGQQNLFEPRMDLDARNVNRWFWPKGFGIKRDAVGHGNGNGSGSGSGSGSGCGSGRSIGRDSKSISFGAGGTGGGNHMEIDSGLGGLNLGVCTDGNNDGQGNLNFPESSTTATKNSNKASFWQPSRLSLGGGTTFNRPMSAHVPEASFEEIGRKRRGIPDDNSAATAAGIARDAAALGNVGGSYFRPGRIQRRTDSGVGFLGNNTGLESLLSNSLAVDSTKRTMERVRDSIDLSTLLVLVGVGCRLAVWGLAYAQKLAVPTLHAVIAVSSGPDGAVEHLVGLLCGVWSVSLLVSYLQASGFARDFMVVLLLLRGLGVWAGAPSAGLVVDGLLVATEVSTLWR